MWNAETLEDYLGEEVVDIEGQPVGTFACYWECDQRNALLLGVDIPVRAGCTHIVPARGARLNERHTYVQVPFARERIVEAPCLECNGELDEELERRVWDFYELSIPGRIVGAGRNSESDQEISRQLRRIVRRDAAPASGNESPPGGATAGEEGDRPGSDQERPQTPGARRSEGAPHDGATREPSSENPL